MFGLEVRHYGRDGRGGPSEKLPITQFSFFANIWLLRVTPCERVLESPKIWECWTPPHQNVGMADRYEHASLTWNAVPNLVFKCYEHTNGDQLE